ncbi:unnamed protein product [Ranitomeya imitator]|uniref:Talin n=1 Tax=Ranitomeya imitator TaxID=111125 RepID=A0ABN9MHX7_9NEOB|nr:unnamed protein product [Ranitomeya imitator]
MSEIEAKARYVKLARSLKTYGVSFFLVKEKMKGKNKLVPRLLGITKECVMRVDEKTKEVIQEWNLTNIKRWAASPKSFTLDFGDYQDGYYSVQTTEGEQIAQLIAGYIDIILKKRWVFRFRLKDLNVMDNWMCWCKEFQRMGDSREKSWRLLDEERISVEERRRSWEDRRSHRSGREDMHDGGKMMSSDLSTLSLRKREEMKEDMADRHSKILESREVTSGPERSTLLQQQFNQVGKVEHGSVALPAIMRSGAGGPENFQVGSMPQAQQQITSGQMHWGHMPPLTSAQQALTGTINSSMQAVNAAQATLEDFDTLPPLGQDAAAKAWRKNKMDESKHEIHSQVDAITAGTASVVNLTAGDPADTDYTAVGCAVTTISSNLTEMSRGVKLLAALMEDEGGNGRQLLHAAKNLAGAVSELLKTAQPASTEPRQVLLQAAGNVGQTSGELLQQIGECDTDPRFQGQYVTLHKEKHYPLNPNGLKKLAGEIEEPLARIFEKSWRTGDVPEDWTRADVSIFKKGKKMEEGNYRPVRLTSIPEKSFEQIWKHHDMLMQLAKAVASAAAALVLKAKNVAERTDDPVQQAQVIAAATQCALSTSQLVACTKVVAPTISSPVCQQQQLLEAGKQVAKSVEGCVESSKDSTSDPELLKAVGVAASAVTQALNDLLQHIKNNASGAPSTGRYDQATDTILNVTENIFSSMGDAGECRVPQGA